MSRNNLENLKDFVGQDKIKNQLKTFIYPKLRESKNCDHIILEGSAGTGKTTLAKIIALENNLPFKSLISSMVKNKSNILSIFCDLEPNTIIFFDEIHRLDIEIEEMLYQIMDEKKINILIGKDGDNQYVSIDLPPFTIVAATTLSGLLSKPLKDRFGFRLYLQDYKQKDIEKIIDFNLNQNLKDELLCYIGLHVKKVPRLAINVAKRLNDYADFSSTKITKDVIDEVLELIGMKNGLSNNDFIYLKLLSKFGPMSITSLANKMSTEPVNIKNDIEPYLIKNNIIEMSSKGRSLTDLGIKILQKNKI